MDTNHDFTKLEYPGELTLEALATLDTYIKQCCNVSATSHKLHKGYLQVRKYLRQPFVRELFQLHLLKKGITPDKISEVISGGLDAKARDGTDDWFTRYKFTQLACEIFEVLKYQYKSDNNIAINQYNITNLQGEALIAEAKKRHIPIPIEIERRFNGNKLFKV